MSQTDLNRSSEDWLFDQIISQLQEIVIDPTFETSLSNYMRNHWGIFDSQCSQQQLQGVFKEYKTQMCTFLQNVPEEPDRIFAGKYQNSSGNCFRNCSGLGDTWSRTRSWILCRV